MKKQVIAVFLLAALTLTVMAGCQSQNAKTHANAGAPASPGIQLQELEEQWKPEKNTPAQPAPAEKSISAAEPISDAPQLLTAQEAEAIALTHAGLTAEEVVSERTELDREEGRQVYEVEFQIGKWEYSYEIDAQTGNILEWEKEYDD